MDCCVEAPYTYAVTASTRVCSSKRSRSSSCCFCPACSCCCFTIVLVLVLVHRQPPEWMRMNTYIHIHLNGCQGLLQSNKFLIHIYI